MGISNINDCRGGTIIEEIVGQVSIWWIQCELDHLSGIITAGVNDNSLSQKLI